MSLREDVLSHLSLWVAAVALFVGVTSVTLSILIANNQAHNDKVSTCQTETRANKAQRDFYAGLLDDPKVPSAVRIQITAAALKQFPLVPLSCITGG